jgi:thiamine monophosphate synthase
LIGPWSARHRPPAARPATGFDSRGRARSPGARGGGAGVTLIPVREQGLTSQLADLVAAIVGGTRLRTAVVVNDRLDVALTSEPTACLRSDSIRRRRRAIAPPGSGQPFVHHVEEAREHASAVDYLIASTVFPTARSRPRTLLA